MRMRYFVWARNEKHALELQALGWRFAAQRPTHHHFYCCLMQWRGKGEPVMGSVGRGCD